MLMDIIDLVLNPQFMVMVLTAVAAFATAVTVMLPLMESDKFSDRMKYVASERDRLRAQRLADLQAESSGGRLRQKPQGFMQQVVQQFNLNELMESKTAREKLRRAGLRGEGPVVAFLFFRMALPIATFAGALFYLFVFDSHQMPTTMRVLIAVAAAYMGLYLPNIFISNLIQRRQKSIKLAFPDALDLLLICVQSGMSIEAAFAKVSKEVGPQSIELAEELSLMTAELSYLQNRRQAYENLANRVALPGVKAVCTSLIQAERYGTPLAQALRTLSQESREMRLAEAEKKAASLPPKLTVPMIVFFLPCLFVVIMGPSVIKLMKM